MIKKISIYRKSAIVLALLALVMLVGCTADDDNNGKDVEYYTLTPVIGTNSGLPVMTRALASAEGDPEPVPSPWDFYEDLYPMSLENDPEIGVFVLKDNNPASFNDNPAWFRYELEKDAEENYKRDEDGKLVGHWTGLNTNVQDKMTYNIFGFMSANNTSWNVTVSPLSGLYENGATMTMSNVKSVTATDVCVVVGVLKAGIDDLNNGDLMRKTIREGGKKGREDKEDEIGLGNYKYKAEKQNNFIYVWLDHLYSCINFELQVESKYSELRKIKLKQVDFTINDVSSAYNITVNVNAHSESVGSTTYAPQGATGKATDAIFKSASGVELPIEGAIPLAIPGYFAPATTLGSQTVEVKFTYDVYTTKGNVLTREDATAVNTLRIGDLLAAAGKTLGPGKLFTVKATIKPTYLYVLADPDLDNPTMDLDIPSGGE